MKNADELIKKKPSYKVDRNQKTPMSGNFVLELDGSAKLDADELTLFQELIEVLRWATEIGRVIILHEVSVLSQYQASARKGHLEQVFNIFSFLKHNPKLSIHMDPQLPEVDYTVFDFNRQGLFEQYRDAEEQVPGDCPRPRGKPIVMTAYVDAFHASKK